MSSIQKNIVRILWAAVFLFVGVGCGLGADCATLDWHDCEASWFCDPSHADSDAPGHPGFECVPRRLR